MLSSFIDRLLGRDITKTRTRKNRRQEGRANLRKELSRHLNLEHLEDRRLLTTYLQGGTAAATVHTGDLYYDSGNVGGDYSNNENSTIVFDGGVGTGGFGTQVRAAFSYIQTAQTFDFLRAYNGNTTASPILSVWTGSYLNQMVQSTNPQLTFWFVSDPTNTRAGWAANIYVINLDPNPIINAGGGDNGVLVQVDPSQRDLTNVFIDRVLVDTFKTADLNSLTINGQAGDDLLTVDLSNGNPLPVNGLRFDGGLGFDGLVLQNGSVTSDTYSPGANPGDGLITLVGGVTRTVSFQNIEPVIDTLVAPTFSITSVPGIASLLDASNAINYTASQLIPGGGGGRVTVDNFEPIEFINKTNLVIDAGAGSDTISLNNPTTPTGLTGSVSVNGGGGSDTVTVTGQASAVDSVVYTPTGADSGKLEVLEVGGLNDIQLTGVDRLIYNGQNKRDATLVESLKVMLPGAATNLVDYEFDSFSFIGSVSVNSNGQPLLPVQFQNIAYTASNGNGIVIDGTATNGDDRLFYGGRSEWDHIVVDRYGLINDLPLALPVQTPGIERLVLLGRGGDDVFDVAADHPYTEVIVTGGSAVTASNPDSGGDLIVLRAASGEFNRAETITVTPNLYTAGETYIKGTGRDQLSTFSTMGVGRIYYAGSPNTDNFSDDTLVVDPGQGTHTVRVDAGRFTGSVASPLVMPGPYDRVTSDSLPQVQGHALNTLRIAPVRIAPLLTGSVAATFVTRDLTEATNYEAALAVNDTLIIEGNDGSADNYAVTAGASGASALAVTDGTSHRSVTATLATLGRLQINTLGGDDMVWVDVDNKDLITVPITFDGGTGSDLLTVRGKPAVDVNRVLVPFTTNATYTPGPLGNQGRLVEVGVGASTKTMTIDFANLEPVVDLIPGILTVNGTNADNAINYTAGTNNGPGVWTGLVSVDSFETIEFTNKTTLTIDGLAGNDTVIINGTTDADKVTITPTAAYAAEITLTTGPVLTPVVAQIKVATTESLIYNGQGGTDELTVVGTGGVDVITHTPGAQIDAGTVQVDSWLPISYGSLGATGTVTIDGSTGIDTLVAYGTGANDTFNVQAPTGAVDLRTSLGKQVLLLQKQVSPGGVLTNTVENLVLNALEGDDTINVDATQLYATIAVNGGDPDASDVLNLNNAPLAVVVDLELATVTGYGGTVSFTGIEHVNLDGADTLAPLTAVNTLTVNGTSTDDRITYTPTGARAGNFQNEGSNTAFAFKDIGGAFTIAGGSAGGSDVADEVFVNGTNNRDTITIDETTRTVQVNLLKAVVLDGTIEVLTARGLDGQDTFIDVPQVVVGPLWFVDNLLVYVDGGEPHGSDALVIASTTAGAALPPTNFVVLHRDADPNAGSIRVFQQDLRVAGNAPFQLPDIAYTDVEVVSPNVFVSGNGDPNLLVMGPDTNEPNEFRATSTFLGSGPVVQEYHAAIFPRFGEHPAVPADQDFFKVVAQKTGTLDFQVYFNQYSLDLLPNGGDLSIQVQDGRGNIVPATFGYNESATGRVLTLAAPLPGSGYTNGSYINVPLTGGAGTGAMANIVIAGGIVTSVSLVNGGSGYVGGNVLSAAAGKLGGTVTVAFSVNVATTGNAVADQGYVRTAERVRIPAIAGQTYYLRVFGSSNAVVNGYDVTVVNDAPPVPYDLELQDTPVGDPPPLNSDTGRSQFDNHTRDNTPTIYFRLDDGIFLHDLPGNDTGDTPPDEIIPIPFQGQTAAAGYRIAIFDEGNTPSQLATAPQTQLGFATATSQEGVYEFTTPSTLTDGSHFLSARVQMIDPATPTQTGWGARSVSLEIVVDTVSTVPYFGLMNQADTTQGLATASDSGVNGYPATIIDRVTNVTTPTFFGTAEANNIVRLYVENGKAVGLQTSGADADIFLGKTVANPLDGTNQFPLGQWTITSSLDLNNPNLDWRTIPTNFYTKDGLRKLYVTAEDLAGNVTPDINADVLNIFLDTAGPQVTRVAVNNVGNSYNLWGLKSTTPPILVPTPLVNSLVISVQDLPARSEVDANFLYSALFQAVATQVGHYHLVGDASGVIPIQGVAFTATDAAGVTLPNNGVPPAATGQLAYGYVTLTFANPLPDDRFTLTIDDDIGDPAGNRLDGESNTVEPQGAPTLPSGNIVPGGSFVARFTVDSRPELGVVAAGSVWVDTNGNSQWDATNVDYTNRDLTYAVQYTDGTGLTDRFVTTDDVFAGNFGATQVATIVAAGASETGTTVTITTATPHGLTAGSVGQQIGINGVGVAGYNGLFLITGVPSATTFTYTATAGLTTPSGNGTVFANDGYSKLAAYGRIGDNFRWLVDTDNDGVAEVRQVNTDVGGAALNINGRPIAWNFDGNAANGDEVGLMAGQTWYLDVNHTYNTRATLNLPLLPPGLPVVGDFDGNGQVDFATWRDDLFTIYLNPTLPTVGVPSRSESIASHVKTINFGFIGTRERPVAADMDMDGITDLGLWVPDRTGTVPQGSGEWYWLMSNQLKATNAARLALVGTIDALNHPFSEVPLGHDLHAVFGDQFAVPVVGNFDPPLAASGAVSGHTNPTLAADVSGDNVVSALDVLLLVSEINANQSHVLTGPVGSSLYLDPNGDGAITASDVLYVVSYVNTQAAGVVGEGEGFMTPAPVTAAASPAATVPAWRNSASVSQPVSTGLVVGSVAADQALQALDDEGLLTRIAADVDTARKDDVLEDFVFEELGG